MDNNCFECVYNYISILAFALDNFAQTPLCKYRYTCMYNL